MVKRRVLAGLIVVSILLYAAAVCLEVSGDESFIVNFPSVLVNAEAWSTEESKTEQARDWLLYSAITALHAPEDDIARALFALPPLRLSELVEAAGYQNGETRWAVIGDDLLVVVPRGSADALIGRAADSFRSTTTRIPDRIAVFRYDMQPSEANATLQFAGWCRGEDYFETSHGYHEARIAALSDVRRFLDLQLDLVHASISSGGILTLGGRACEGTPSLATDDVAVLFQKGEERSNLLRDLHQRHQDLDPERLMLLGYYDIDEDSLSRALAPALGFSLDPFDAWTYQYLLTLEQEGLSQTHWENVCDAIARGDDLGGIGEAILYWEGPNEDLELLLYGLEYAWQYLSLDSQCPRYGGAINATEVGMTMYYCDLLMKLWGFDYELSTPQALGMSAMPEIAIPSAEWGPCWDYPSTRLWLGPCWEQLGHSPRELFFGPIGVRTYAASSGYVSWGEEVEPNPENWRFIAWWESHWDDIMAYEPQYARLNQLMKWSTLVSWLDLQGHAGLPDVAAVDVDRDRNFRTWLTDRAAELTYAGDLPFLDPCNGECIELLESRMYWSCGLDGAYFEGGVSPASEEELAVMLASGLLPSDVWQDILGIAAGASGSVLTLNGTTYSIDLAVLSIASVPAPRLTGDRISGDWVAWPQGELLRHQLVKDSESFAVWIDLGDSSLGLLSIAQDGHRIDVLYDYTAAFVARDLVEDLATGLSAEGMQLPYPILGHLSRRGDIASLHQLDDGDVLAETKDGEWVLLGTSIEGEVQAGISDKNSLDAYVFAGAAVGEAQVVSRLGQRAFDRRTVLIGSISPRLGTAETAVSLLPDRVMITRCDGVVMSLPFAVDSLLSQDEEDIALRLLDPSEGDPPSLQAAMDLLDAVASMSTELPAVLFLESATGRSAAEYRAIDQCVKAAKWLTSDSWIANLAVVHDQPVLEETIEGLQEISLLTASSTAVFLHGCEGFSEWISRIEDTGALVLIDPDDEDYVAALSNPRLRLFIIVADGPSSVPLAVDAGILSHIAAEHVAISLLVGDSWSITTTAIAHPQVELVYYMDGALRVGDAIEVAYHELEAFDGDRQLREAADAAWLETLAGQSEQELQILLMEYLKVAAKG